MMVTDGRKREFISIDLNGHNYPTWAMDNQDHSCVPWISACNPESGGLPPVWSHAAARWAEIFTQILVWVFGGGIPIYFVSGPQAMKIDGGKCIAKQRFNKTKLSDKHECYTHPTAKCKTQSIWLYSTSNPRHAKHLKGKGLKPTSTFIQMTPMELVCKTFLLDLATLRHSRSHRIPMSMENMIVSMP
jgi:hypothetical protein